MILNRTGFHLKFKATSGSYEASKKFFQSRQLKTTFCEDFHQKHFHEYPEIEFKTSKQAML